MLSHAGREFLVRIRVIWKPLFQGRLLLYTNTICGGVMFGLGDSLQQTWEKHKDPRKERNWRRTGQMFIVGCSFGPLIHYWYLWLDRVFVGRTVKAVTKKVLVDQLVLSPIMGLWYFAGMGLTQGRSLSDGCDEFKDKFWDYYKAEWCVWPPAQAINFYFLPPKYRVVYDDAVNLGWDTYLSYLKHREESHSSVVADSHTPEESKTQEKKT